MMRTETYADGKLVATRDDPAPVLSPEQTNRATLGDRATQALATNATFLALQSPTAAQTLAQVRALTRQHSALFRLLLGLLDDTD